MRYEPYSRGTVSNLIETDLVATNTKAVLKKRLNKGTVIVPLFFELETFYSLRAVCKQLIPQINRATCVDLASLVDERLHTGQGKGWRYDKVPGDEILFTLGLKGIDETSLFMFNKEFTALGEADKNKVLRSVQTGFTKGNTWKQVPPQLFFEELLALVTELYYSHPFGKDEIGEVAFADAKGWTRIGLNELEDREPKTINSHEQ